MPQTSDDFIWWAFNLVFLALAWFIKQDIGQIKRDGKDTNARQVAADLKSAASEAACAERHKRLDYELGDIKERIK